MHLVHILAPPWCTSCSHTQPWLVNFTPGRIQSSVPRHLGDLRRSGELNRVRQGSGHDEDSVYGDGREGNGARPESFSSRLASGQYLRPRRKGITTDCVERVLHNHRLSVTVRCLRLFTKDKSSCTHGATVCAWTFFALAACNCSCVQNGAGFSDVSQSQDVKYRS